MHQAKMEKKLATVQESLIDLSISLNSRIGYNQFALFAFPGKRDETELLIDWTPKLNSLTQAFTKISSGGITPTGPPLRPRSMNLRTDVQKGD